MTFDRTADDAFRSLEPDDTPATADDGLEALVRHVVAAHLEVDACDVRSSHALERDLGISRLGLVLIALDLEDLERVSMPFEQLGEVHTVSDLARLLKHAPSAVH